MIRIQSQGYPMCQVDVTDLEVKPEEVNSTPALIRGVAARFTHLGCKVQGFDAYVESTVLPGSGLSSSAAYEVLIGTIINGLFFDGKVSQPKIARIGQYAENVYFGKEVLTQIDEKDFYAAIPALREKCGDRAVLQHLMPLL